MCGSGGCGGAWGGGWGIGVVSGIEGAVNWKEGAVEADVCGCIGVCWVRLARGATLSVVLFSFIF